MGCIYSTFSNLVQYNQFNDLLDKTIISYRSRVGVMLSLHIPGALVVLLYAITRKLLLLPKGGGMLN